MPIRLVDKPERGHAERSSVAGAGGGRNGVEASRVISVDARISDFHATGSFTPRRPATLPRRRCVQDDLRFFQPVILSANRIGMEGITDLHLPALMKNLRKISPLVLPHPAAC